MNFLSIHFLPFSLPAISLLPPPILLFFFLHIKYLPNSSVHIAEPISVIYKTITTIFLFFHSLEHKLTWKLVIYCNFSDCNVPADVGTA